MYQILVFEIFLSKNELSETLNFRKIGPKTGQMDEIQPVLAYPY